ncbi:MAG TPA: zinc ribbon domain-containing protein [Chloroflexia bacterium]|nr:zinc ribbon domain-containing protein [Chloroflexia bacterium]
MKGAKLGICTNCQKALVEPVETCPHCGEANTYKGIDDELIKLIERGQMTDAMKRVMRLTGWGLKESKDYLDVFRSGGRR